MREYQTNITLSKMTHVKYGLLVITSSKKVFKVMISSCQHFYDNQAEKPSVCLSVHHTVSSPGTAYIYISTAKL